jgi:pilus assembly protein CpaC
VTQDLAKFPWLGDLPVLGALFRSTQFQRNETELVIIVTPYIVKPVSAASRLQTPTDGFVPPTDQQRVSEGALFRQQPAKLVVGPPGQAQVPRGTVGFEID